MDLITPQVAVCILLAGVLAGATHAQESRGASPAASAGSSSPAPAKKGSPATDRVILKVGSVQVTQTEFESGIGSIEPQGEAEKEAPSDKDRRKLGDDYASVLMLSQRALADHLDSSPEVSRQLAIDRLQILSDAEFERLMNQAQPTPEEISQYYSSHGSDYEEVRIRRLFIWKRGENSKNVYGLSPQDARSRADAVLQTSAAGGDAKKLADAFNDSKDGMFDKEPLIFPRGELPPKMENTAFTIKEGAWSEIEDTPDSLILLQLVKRNRRPLEEVSSLIEKRLQAQKMEAQLDNLKKNTGIWMDEQYFGTAVAPVPGTQRPTSNPPNKLRKSAKKGESNNEDK